MLAVRSERKFPHMLLGEMKATFALSDRLLILLLVKSLLKGSAGLLSKNPRYQITSLKFKMGEMKPKEKKLSSACHITLPLQIPTGDVLLELVVRLLECLHQLGDAALLDQGHLVVHVLIDEVARGAGGIALHFLILGVEQLHQLADAFGLTNLETRREELTLIRV